MAWAWLMLVGGLGAGLGALGLMVVIFLALW